MTLHPVQSSSIAAVGYDAPTKTLAVKFKQGGREYHYYAVEPGQHEALLKADSIGKHMTGHIIPRRKVKRVK